MAKTMKPTMILMSFFGQKDGQTKADFVAECRELKGTGDQPSEDFIETVNLAAYELGVEPDFS